jgi:serine/threonine protein kinase
LKPENILIDHRFKLKIADFGSSVEISNLNQPKEYLTTIWYRSPEKLLNLEKYSESIDVWSIGCIVKKIKLKSSKMAELFLKKPLFNGKNEIDQFFQICSILGTPQENEWKEGHRKSIKLGIQFPTFVRIELATMFEEISHEGFDLLSKLLLVNPLERITCKEALKHNFFFVK